MKTTKTILTTIALILAFIQGPVLYYCTSGFFELFGADFFGLTGLLLTIILFSQILQHKSSNTKYHLLGFALAFFIGTWTYWRNPTEYFDFKLRMSERNKIIDQFKNGTLKSAHLPGSYFLPISNGGNDLDILENGGDIVSIGFYIDRGFIDHASEFLYTNNPDEIQHLETQIRSNDRDTVVKKLADNWYRMGY